MKMPESRFVLSVAVVVGEFWNMLNDVGNIFGGFGRNFGIYTPGSMNSLFQNCLE